MIRAEKEEALKQKGIAEQKKVEVEEKSQALEVALVDVREQKDKAEEAREDAVAAETVAVKASEKLQVALVDVRKQKDKAEKAKKLYSQAFEKLNKAYKSDKKNPDILNYMGFTSRKNGNFEEAETYYLKGLDLDPKHNGINEYLGELYVQTKRIDKANERLAVLKDCDCDEYKDLELIIKTRGTKIY